MIYDVIIIGAGPAGISASLYTKRANKNTLVIYQDVSNLNEAEIIHNYYGFENGIRGKDLYYNGIRQAQNLGVQLTKEQVINIEVKGDLFKVKTFENEYQTKSVIIAIGNKKNKLNIKGIDKLEGKGISYCAICDGFFYKNKTVAVLGSGDYAISESKDLVNIVDKLYILTDGNELPKFQKDNVEVITKPIDEIIGENKVEEIKFKDESKLKVDGIFVAQGIAGSIEFAKKVGLQMNKDNFLVNDKMETNIKGIYACGDCIGGLLQISKAVHEGSTAGIEVIKFLNNQKENK